MKNRILLILSALVITIINHAQITHPKEWMLFYTPEWTGGTI